MRALGGWQDIRWALVLALAALLLGETVSAAMLAATLAAVVCVAGARRYA